MLPSQLRAAAAEDSEEGPSSSGQDAGTLGDSITAANALITDLALGDDATTSAAYSLVVDVLPQGTRSLTHSHCDVGIGPNAAL